MNKKADVAGSFGKGLGYGIAAGSAVELARFIVGAIDDYKSQKKRTHPKIDRNTIVLTLPKKPVAELSEKASSARDQFDDDKASRGKDVKIDDTSRDTLGRFTPGWLSKKAQSWPWWLLAGAGATATVGNMDPAKEAIKKSPGEFMDHTGTILGGVAGLSLGYVLARKIAQKIEEKRLEREIAAAQKEYIGILQNKAASYDILPVLPTEKKADSIMGDSGQPFESSQGNPSWTGKALASGAKALVDAVADKDNAVNKAIHNAVEPLAPATAKGIEYGTWAFSAGTAATILTALSIAYVTKKMLDKKYGNPNAKKDVVPRNTRVLFKTSSAEEPFEISPATAICALSCIKAAMEQESKFEKEAIDLNPPGHKGERWWKPSQQATREPVKPRSNGRVRSNNWSLTGGKMPVGTSIDDYMADRLSNEDNFTKAMGYISGQTSVLPDKPGGLNPVELLDKYNSELTSIFGSPELGSYAIKTYAGSPDKLRALAGSAIQKNPKLVRILNEKFPGWVNQQAENYLNNYFSENGSGFGKAISSGWLGKTPIGDWLKKFMLWLFKNNQAARTWGFRKGLSQLVKDTDEVKRIIEEAYPANTPLNPKFAMAKEANIASVMESLANFNINTDESNKTLDAKLNMLLENLNAKKRMTKQKYVSIRGDKDSEEFVRKNREKILQIIREINAENE